MQACKRRKNKIDNLHRKTPECHHYQYRKRQQPALASPRQTARYERIPPDGFGVAALENCCPRASPRGCGHRPLHIPRKAILHTNSNAHVNSFTTAGMVSMDTSVVTAKMWEA